MKHIFTKGLAAAGMAATLGVSAIPAQADVVLTPQDRVVVYRDLVTDPYPSAGGYYHYDNHAYGAPAYGAPVYGAPGYGTPAYATPPAYYEPAPRWDVRVGGVVPEGVPLQPVPQTVAVPTVYGYDYAVIEERVVLVEPRSRRIFEVLQETSQ